MRNGGGIEIQAPGMEHRLKEQIISWLVRGIETDNRDVGIVRSSCDDSTISEGIRGHPFHVDPRRGPQRKDTRCSFKSHHGAALYFEALLTEFGVAHDGLQQPSHGFVGALNPDAARLD